jgi:hypothetical protein
MLTDLWFTLWSDWSGDGWAPEDQAFFYSFPGLETADSETAAVGCSFVAVNRAGSNRVKPEKFVDKYLKSSCLRRISLEAVLLIRDILVDPWIRTSH